MTALSVLLTIGLILRLTRLVVADEILHKFRVWIVLKLGPNNPIAVLVTCSWCMSVWIGAAVGAAWWAWGDHRWWLAVGTAASASLLAGWSARWIDTERED